MASVRLAISRSSLFRPRNISRALYYNSRVYQARTYAAGRKNVTVFNDDGRTNWTDLRGREKAARTTQQTVNLLVILTGVALTSAVGYLLYTQVFSRHSHTSQFNHAVKRIKTSPECIDLLGPPESIAAFGHTVQRWRRQAGPTPYINESKDPKTGIQQLRMRFLVRGSKGEGWVNLHMQWDEKELEYIYLLLSLDVQGHNRIVLEGTKSGFSRSSGNLFGIKWR